MNCGNPLPNRELLQTSFTYDHEDGTLVWKLSPAPRVPIGTKVSTKPYTKVRIGKGRFYVHRLIWKLCMGYDPKYVIDHIDGNPSNNKIENLRDVPQEVNLQNQLCPHKNNKSGFLGVVKVTNSLKYSACIRRGKQHYYLGTHDTKEEASQAYEYYKQRLVEGP